MFTKIPSDEIVPKPKGGRFIDMEGRSFGRLTAVAYAGGPFWWFRCACGAVCKKRSKDVRRGDTKSCGCLHREAAAERVMIHGLSYHPLWGTWKALRYRCENPKARMYHRYGGRGIRIHPSWLEDPARFLAYAESLPHYGEEGRSLDRIDNDGNYEPGNLRWVTQQKQVENSTSPTWLTRPDGVSDSVSGWARELGFKTSGGLRRRLREGWDLGVALSTPKGCAPGSELPMGRLLARSDGLTMNCKQWCAFLGLKPPAGIHTRLALGWDLEEILWTPKGQPRRRGPE